MASEPDSLEVVGTYSSSLEARLARCRLESAGSESFIFGDIPGARCGPIRLCVGRNDLADAHSLLAVTPPPKAVSDDLQDAVRVGLAIGGITGGSRRISPSETLSYLSIHGGRALLWEKPENVIASRANEIGRGPALARRHNWYRRYQFT